MNWLMRRIFRKTVREAEEQHRRALADLQAAREMLARTLISTVTLHPGDIVVLRLKSPPRLTPSAVRHLSDLAHEKFPNHEVLLLTDCDIDIVRPTEVLA